MHEDRNRRCRQRPPAAQLASGPTASGLGQDLHLTHGVMATEDTAALKIAGHPEWIAIDTTTDDRLPTITEDRPQGKGVDQTGATVQITVTGSHHRPARAVTHCRWHHDTDLRAATTVGTWQHPEMCTFLVTTVHGGHANRTIGHDKDLATLATLEREADRTGRGSVETGGTLATTAGRGHEAPTGESGTGKTSTEDADEGKVGGLLGD
jgi:hypothetical protein